VLPCVVDFKTKNVEKLNLKVGKVFFGFESENRDCIRQGFGLPVVKSGSKWLVLLQISKCHLKK
jgi:hypothetical protein